MDEYNINLNFSLAISSYRLSGNLAWEYHPFRNFLMDESNIQITDDGFYIPENKAINKKNGGILEREGEHWIDKYKNIIDLDSVIEYNSSSENIIEKDNLVDLDTELLNFDINHPIEMEILPSYDGSVNVILNDNKNITRLINSRFSPREKNTYEIVDRVGENDTNIYAQSSFDKDTSLYFLCGTNPIISFEKLITGQLQVGQYCFYITYCDADENESDIVAESGPIPIFIGKDGDLTSMDGGIKNLQTDKGIELKITSLESSYNYIKLYYVRYYADYLQHRVLECKKFYKKFSIQNRSELIIDITGIEDLETIDANIININKFNAKAILTQTLCKNMLFFGNIKKNTDNYKELTDCALKIIPQLTEADNHNEQTDSVYNYKYTGYMNEEYYRFGVVFIYNNGTLSNVYNTLGLICSTNKLISYNDTKSLIYEDANSYLLRRKYIISDLDGWITNSNDFFKENSSLGYENSNLYLNSKGVCKIDYHGGEQYKNKIIGIKFTVPESIISYLKLLGIRGLFFVRLKRIPNIIALCMTLPIDSELEGPILYSKYLNEDNSIPTFKGESFLYKKRTINNNNIEKLLGHEYLYRLNTYYNENKKDKDNKYECPNCKTISKKAFAGICPDFLLDLPYYNQIFNGSTFILKEVYSGYLESNRRFGNFGGKRNKNTTETNTIESESPFGASYTYGSLTGETTRPSEGPIPHTEASAEDVTEYGRMHELNNINFNSTKNKETIKAKICSVTEDVKQVSLEDLIYRLEIGVCEEAYKFRLLGLTMAEGDNNIFDGTNLARGIFSPYLAIYTTEGTLKQTSIYNIYKDDASLNDDRLKIKERMSISEPFYAISDRYNFKKEGNQEVKCFRGDSFINNFTYRLNRNFNDPSMPNNDTIIDNQTWISHAKNFGNIEKLNNISRADVNAVTLGSWINFNVISSFNYNLRSEDHSFVSEKALMGSPRTYVPRVSKPWLGTYKMPDSYLYNDAFRATLGFKLYYTLEDMNYLKNTFSNRIQYSEMAILDSFKNNYRESLSTYFRDYSSEYGGITRLIGFEGYILVVFEHAIGIAVINERILAGEGDGEPVFINTKNVLPEELTIISDTYGTQWSESVVKSEAGYVYGVDTIAKKIWRVKGQEIEILSDFKVNGFLTDNITLGERELTPIVGLKNIKSHYNNNKKDIMFTFYDDIYKDEEKIWNLCYNELLGEFVTFYSWVPSYSENIDTQYFSFNRNSSKNIALLYKSNYYINDNYGVLLDSPVIANNKRIYLYYRKKELEIYTILCSDGLTDTITKKSTPYFLKNVHFDIKHDHWKNYKLFKYGEEYISENVIRPYIELLDVLNGFTTEIPEIIYLEITPYIDEDGVRTEFETEIVALTKTITKKFTTDFYLHGKSGIIDIQDPLLPCYWYGEQHPFEFEFVVTENLGQLKIFNNLIIISNKAEPESFHFEIEGDNYEFSSDKRTMYYRLELTKHLYLNLGSDILFDRKYKKCKNSDYTKEQYYRQLDLNYTKNYNNIDKVYPIYSEGLVQQVKSTIFPLYYERVDTYNEIYHSYRNINENGYDFKNLSGSEIVWDNKLNLFNIVTHIKNNPIDRVGRIRGNSFYKEGKWNVQIPSINFMLKNELSWNVPPIIINSEYLPNDITNSQISRDVLPNIVRKTDDIHKYVLFSNDGWTNRKSTRIRDKWIKIRVRYSGKNLAVIHSLVTLYNLSYS